MTIEEIEKTLPSGFHDACLEKLNIDYGKREVTLEISVDIGAFDSPRGELKEANRKGILTVSGLLFCVIEPPDSRSPYQKAKGLWITDSGPVKSAKLLAKLPESLPNGVFAHYFFINEWNAFIIVVATGARFDWS
ncbi:MAG: hypothetical protein HY092_00020 [Candidatus Kerfeldbacteria bacterium]|nr:hypothetical protein [Candidatus Kerfeldbacteria bacterium]